MEPTDSSPRRSLATMLALALLVLGLDFYHGELIQVADGLGADGAKYARITREFPDILQEGVGPLYAGRILPPILVHMMMRTAGISFENANIIAAFKIYYGLLVLGSILIWNLICNHLGFGKPGRWLGFTALFVNCAHLEFQLYYPILTDGSAFFVSMWMLYSYLRGNSLVLYILSFAGAFTWPTLMYFGLILFVFPRCLERVEPAPKIIPTLFGIGSILGVSAGLAVAYITGFREGLKGPWYTPTLWGYSALALSTALVFRYVFLVSRDLTNNGAYYKDLRYYFSSDRLLRITLALALYTAASYLTASLMTHQGQYLREQFLVGSLLRATQRPLVSYVMHVLYLGPAILLAVYHWKRIVPKIHSYGLGMTLFAALSTVLMIQPLSRQSITVLPVLAMFIILTMEQDLREPNLRELWSFAILSFVLSRAWFPVNYALKHWPVEGEPWFYLNVTYPKWFSDTAYIPELISVTLLSWWAFAYLRRRDRVLTAPKQAVAKA